MQSMALKLTHLLENLEKDDYDKAVSYIEFLASAREKEKNKKETVDVEAIIASLIGAIPDTGKSLEEYREERLKKYEVSN